MVSVPQPDTQSFSRLLATLGLFLCVVAVVGPVLLLRDTGVLELTVKDLDELTPVAKAELERRQRTAATMGDAAPWVALATFVVGLIVFGIGLYRLFNQEATRDERTALELDQLRGELQPQTPTERRRAAERSLAGDDAAEDEEPDLGPEPEVEVESEPEPEPEVEVESEVEPEPEPESEVESKSEPEPKSTGKTRRAERLRHVLSLTDLVIDRLAVLAGDRYEFRYNVTLAHGRSRLELDAVLASRFPGEPDVVVEIKVPGAVTVGAVTRYFEQVTSLASAYGEQTGRPTRPWLIIAADDVPQSRQKIEDVVESVAEAYACSWSVVRTNRLESLKRPTFTR